MGIVSTLYEVPDIARFLFFPGKEWAFPEKRWVVIAFMIGTLFGMMLFSMFLIVMRLIQ
jgi:hypothetical protein